MIEITIVILKIIESLIKLAISFILAYLPITIAIFIIYKIAKKKASPPIKTLLSDVHTIAEYIRKKEP